MRLRYTTYSIATGVKKTKTKLALGLTAAMLMLGSSGGLSLVAFNTAQASPGAVIYNAIPDPVPSNVASVGYEATATSEFGDRITLAGASGLSPSVTVLMSSWACQTGAWTTNDCATTSGATFTHDITLNVYTVGSGGAVGSLITSKTQTFEIPYRPSVDTTHGCTGGKWWDGTSCNNGIAAPITFTLSGLSADLPTDVILGVEYNTSHYGPAPLGTQACSSTAAGCPYDSLNVGIPTGQTASVGSDNNADVVYWNSTYSGRTPGLATDTGWTPNGTVAFRVDATPTLDAPSLIAPLNNAVVNGATLLSDWTDVAGANHYYYQSCNDSACTSERFHSNYTTSEKTATNVANATFWWHVRAVDANGVSGPWSDTWKVTIDNDAPNVAITNPTDGSTVHGVVNVKGTVTDAHPDHYYTVVKNSSNAVVAGPGVVNDNNSFTNQHLFNWDTTLVPNGNYVVDLEARDAAQNKDAGSTATVNVTVKNTPQSKDDCKDGHWSFYSDMFKNQGQCVKYVEEAHEHGHENEHHNFFHFTFHNPFHKFHF